ncbi:NAD(P)H-dependent oxidoreductase [Luxibacter massiliensis]|uniref:NAD(P)H-dependent oxidoreductase n=1 Tax=Luxibacter massiliensis TaxID=2219695 RepID=UPI000F057E08|nr:NAD(P)H-dependent oxidoreductase [Luxibacter massiliensis]
MRLILSDKYLNLTLTDNNDTKFIDLSSLKITNCVGCFGCWTKTPGKCVIRDDAVKVYPYIAKSDTLIYISRTRYGGYDTIMKTMLERAIPIQQAFIRMLDGETHHVQRSVSLKNAIIIAYGEMNAEEKEVFEKLIERNAKNMNFKQYKVLFTDEEKLQETVEKEIVKWNV